MIRLLLVAALALPALAACSPAFEAPSDTGVCWHMVTQKSGPPRFNKVAVGVPKLEVCMANLEALRISFLQKGGSRTTLTGAYQGSFIYLQPEGIFVSQKYNLNLYLAMVRTGDGRLAMPGAVVQTP